MKAPAIYGQGALFAFSGLEGKTDFDTQLVGSLLGDHPGIHFCTKESFELYIDTKNIVSIEWDAVASDVISGRLVTEKSEKSFFFVFASNGTVVGKCPDDRLRLVFTTGINDGISLTKCGEYFFLTTEDKTDCSADTCEALLQKRLEFFSKKQSPVPDSIIGEAFAKSVSIMKSQVYSAEGIFKQHWTTPNRFPHRFLWLWDSCFHSMGNRFISEELAKESILSVLDAQDADGFIAHRASPTEHSDITQPPVIAWSVEKIVRRTGDIDFAKQCYDRLAAYLEWDIRHRRTESGLFFWHIQKTSVVCRCDESGMDNCSRFDDVEEMECIDFSCFMVKEANAMRYLAELLGKTDEVRKWAALAADTADLINKRLWDENDGYYYDWELKTQSLHKVKSVASFLPLWAGVCPENRVPRLLSALNDEKQFNTPFARSGISRDDKTFGADMWCGPVWINYIYFLAEGLYRYGQKNTADELIRNTVSEITRWYISDGVFYGFYDPMGRVSPRTLNRKGHAVTPYLYGGRYQVIRDYGWTATLFAAMVMEHSELFA